MGRSAKGLAGRAARALYRSFGFETYGTEPNALKVDDRYIDEDYMILRITTAGS
jgi:hypothetical protein